MQPGIKTSFHNPTILLLQLFQSLTLLAMNGVIMNRTIISFSIFLTCFSPTFAQYGNPFLKVDTVTAGECDDLRPVFSQDFWGIGSAPFEWLAFERRTGEESAIAVKKHISTSTSWDTSVTIVSKRPLPDEEKLPQISYINSYSGNRRWILAWQRKTNNVWNIYYSIFKNDSSGWSQPTALTSDSVSNTNVLARAYRDSTFMIAWKKKNVILYTLMTPSTVKPPDTLAISNFDSLEFDFAFHFSEGGVIWTSRGADGNSLIIKRQVLAYPSFTLTAPETLAVRGKLSHPQFAYQYYSYDGPVLYEKSVDSAGGNHEIFASDGQGTTNLSRDPNVDSRNVKTFRSPVVTVSITHFSELQYFWSDVLVMEKYLPKDSLLVFQRSSYFLDTLSGPGHNRDACISSGFQYLPKYLSTAAIIVWESNRSGRSHIYSRLVLIPIGDVKQENQFVQNFELMQNFPNPFNPTTTIRFHLSMPGFASLKIFDLLGREVESLVGEKLSAGSYSVPWDGKEYSSGVYFYRLQAGNFVETKKLILLK